MRKFLKFCFFLFISSCTSTNLWSPASTNPPKHIGTVVPVSKTITIGENETLDGKGNLYKWVGAGDCSQTENMPPMFVLLSGATLKNIWIENAPDGVHIKGSNVTIDNLINVDVCEDAVSISKSKKYLVGSNITIKNSKFYYCEDKGIQLTRGSNILIKRNEFYDCSQPIRIKENAKNIQIIENRIWKANNGVKVTGGQAVARGNTIIKSKRGFWIEKSGILLDQGDNRFGEVKENYRQTESGKINR
ncbi:pectate lyase [Bdellovibrionota bacterium]